MRRPLTLGALVLALGAAGCGSSSPSEPTTKHTSEPAPRTALHKGMTIAQALDALGVTNEQLTPSSANPDCLTVERKHDRVALCFTNARVSRLKSWAVRAR